MLTAHRAASLGENEHKRLFSLALGGGRVSLSPPGSRPARTGGALCPTVGGYEPINSEMCSRSPGAVTHQGAVVQESGGEVAAEAEGQDVALPGAEDHLALWNRQALVC